MEKQSPKIHHFRGLHLGHENLRSVQPMNFL